MSVDASACTVNQEPSLTHAYLRVEGLIRALSSRYGYCWAGVKHLAEQLGMARRTVQRAIRALVSAGRIVRKPRTRGNGSDTTARLYPADLYPRYGGDITTPPNQLPLMVTPEGGNAGARSGKPVGTHSDPIPDGAPIAQEAEEELLLAAVCDEAAVPRVYRRSGRRARAALRFRMAHAALATIVQATRAYYSTPAEYHVPVDTWLRFTLDRWVDPATWSLLDLARKAGRWAGDRPVRVADGTVVVLCPDELDAVTWAENHGAECASACGVRVVSWYPRGERYFEGRRAWWAPADMRRRVFGRSS